MSKKSRHKKNKRIRTKRNIFADIPIWMSAVFICLGVVLGSIFSYDCLYLGKIIDREDTVGVSGMFDSYEYSYSPKSGAVVEVQINFIDRESLYLDAYHIEMEEKLEALEHGEQLDMLLHPNSEYIWEMTTEDDVILSFDDAKSRTQLEKSFFGVILVGFCFICVSMGIISLFVKYREHKNVHRGDKRISK